MADELDPSSAKLIERISKDKSLAKKLDIFLAQEEKADKKRTLVNPPSPVKTKRVRIKNSSLSDGPHCSYSLPKARSPDVVAPEQETSNDGAGNSLEKTDSQELGDGSESSDEEDAYKEWEKELTQSGSDEESSEASNSSDFEVMGNDPKPNWSPSQKTLDWFLAVADLDLKKETTAAIHEEYRSTEEIDSHFLPPRFPAPLWAAVQNSGSDVFRLKSLLKAQENLYLATKPLLSVAEKCPKELRPEILKAIQLICFSNLNLNRFRRNTVAPHLKIDLRKQLLQLPVKHDSLFGSEFSKITDNLIKENLAIEKILVKKQFSPMGDKSASSSHHFGKKFRSRGGKSFRGKPRGGKRPFFHKTGGNSNFTPSPFPPKSGFPGNSSDSQY